VLFSVNSITTLSLLSKETVRHKLLIRTALAVFDDVVGPIAQLLKISTVFCLLPKGPDQHF